MVHHRIYQLFIFNLELGIKVTQNIAQYPLHNVTYAAVKFEVARSNGLGGDAFTKTRWTHGRTIKWPFRWLRAVCLKTLRVFEF